ncbi:MAG: LD-carboxypeptidase [Pseudomonadota bacterium]
MKSDRRLAIKGLAAATVIGAAPQSVFAQPVTAPTPTFPARLKRGDTAMIVAPAGAISDPFSLTLSTEALQAMGLKVKVGKYVLGRHGYLAGTDKERAEDVNAAFADPDVKAVFCLRGGWGCARMLPFVDFSVIAQNPKAIIGYSDVTTLLNAIYAKTGLVTFHGPNGDSPWREETWRAFKSLLFDGKKPRLADKPYADGTLAKRALRSRVVRPGMAEGRIAGGTLTLMTNLIGSPYMPDLTGHILCLEEVDEYVYRCDRMLTQLANAGILDDVAGVVLGSFTGCTVQPTGRISGFTLMEVFQHHFASRDIPCFYGLQFGHVETKLTLPIGARAKLDTADFSLTLLEPAVS